MKSILLINGNDPKALLNSTLYGADAVAYDLHEAVGTADKDAARLLLQEALAFFDFGDSGVFVRVNPLSEGGTEDIAVAGKGKPQAFILPRADAESLPKADAAVAALEAENGFAPGSAKLIPTVESVAAVENINALLASCPRIAAVVFNAANFLKDLGVADTGDAMQILHARSKVALACRAAGVPAIDRPWYDAKDRAGFEADARNARALGFTGKLAVNGGQVPLIDQGYIAGFEESVHFDITTVKGLKNKFFSGEGMFLATLSGPGKIWLQTMPFSVLADRVISLVPKN